MTDLRLAHVSDLHFGRIQEGLVPALQRALREAEPDLVVVSGDLTQRARRREFAAARHFLEHLPCDWLAVPGNHDIPAYNVAARFLHPFRRYRRYVDRDLMPVWRRGGAVVVGINSARRHSWSLNWADGRVSVRQMEAATRFLEAEEDATHRIVVAHHPFLKLADDGDRHKLVGRHGMATKALRRAGVDLILAGHLHRSYHGRLDLDEEGKRLFVVQAGTATSTRRRGQANAFHLLDLRPGEIAVEAREWCGGGFHPVDSMRLAQGNDGQWRVVEGEEPEPLGDPL